MARSGFRLALVATLLALVVVILGAYTRLTHAGLGCPDWPGCYSFISVPQSQAQIAHAELQFPGIPVEADKGWNEMLHRYFAGSLGVVIGLLAVRAWRERWQRKAAPLKLPLLLLGVALLQAAFGMWTVTLKLWPQVVTAHLLGGCGTLALLFLLALRLSGRFPALPGVPSRVRFWAVSGLLLVIGQIALGGWVSANYAAQACVDFPTCQGQWWPDADFTHGFYLGQQIGPNYLGGRLGSEARTAIHLTHRLGALAVSGVLLGLGWELRRIGQTWLAGLLLTSLVLQVGLGLSNVLLEFPLSLAIAHSCGGVALLLTLVLINYCTRVCPLPVANAPPSRTIAVLPMMRLSEVEQDRSARVLYRGSLPQVAMNNFKYSNSYLLLVFIALLLAHYLVLNL